MMNSKRNQTIAIARFLMYKHSLNQQLDGMTDEEYLADPIGLDAVSYTHLDVYKRQRPMRRKSAGRWRCLKRRTI